MGRKAHRGGAPKGAINLSAPDGAPLPYFGETEGKTEAWPGTQFHRAAEHCLLRGLFDNRIGSERSAGERREPGSEHAGELPWVRYAPRATATFATSSMAKEVIYAG